MTLDPLTRHEPLFRDLRRHHPDVTLVLLPPQRSGVPDDPMPLAEARDLTARTRGLSRSLEQATGPAFDVASELWWKLDGAGAYRFVVRSGLRGLERGQEVELLRALAGPLLDGSWRTRAGDEPHPVIEALRAPFTVRAEALPGALDLTVSTATVLLDRGTAEALDGSQARR